MTIHKCFINLSKICQLNCTHCFYSAGVRRPDELSPEQWLKVLSSLKDIGIKEVDVLGGEPTILPHFYKIMEEVNDFKRSAVQTNAVTMEKEMFKYIKNALVSLESPYPEENDKVRGAFTHERAIKNIIKMRKAGVNVTIRATLYRNTDVKEFMKLAKGLDAGLAFTRFYPLGRGAGLKELEPTKEKLKETYKLLLLNKNAFKGKQLVINDPQFFIADAELFTKYKNLFEKQGRVCPFGLHNMTVDQNGDVYPCVFQLRKDFRIGNMLKDTYEDILHNMHAVTKKIMDAPLIEQCKNCKYVKYCGGGCLIYFDGETRGDYLCPLSKVNNNGS